MSLQIINKDETILSTFPLEEHDRIVITVPSGDEYVLTRTWIGLSITNMQKPIMAQSLGDPNKVLIMPIEKKG